MSVPGSPVNAEAGETVPLEVGYVDGAEVEEETHARFVRILPRREIR